MNGGIAKKDLTEPNVDAVRAGAVNLKRHIENLKKFGITPTIAINHFYLDTDEEIAVIEEMAKVDASHAITISAHTTLGTSPIVRWVPS